VLPGAPAGDGWLRREVVVRQRVGTHLRVIKRIFERAQRLRAELFLDSGQHRASAASMLDLMQLAARTGDRLRIEARGPDAERAAAFAAALLHASEWDAEIPDA
jgi:phosphotransferase system HPr (HPr) family protein